jgi:uncharacterized protein YfkK (UPF0435 family)
MITDGFSCSLLFILKKYKDKEYGDKLPKYVEDEEIVKHNLTPSEMKEIASKLAQK